MGRQSDANSLKQFGATVRSFRLEAAFSQEELAHRCGLDRSYIGGVERGERNVSLLNILKISRALNLAPSKLMDCFER
jgi:transcriptional regulator with XRE-family HTH domain